MVRNQHSFLATVNHKFHTLFPFRYPTPHHHQYPERCTTINNGGTNYSSVVADIGIGRGISPQMLCAPTGSLLPLNFTQPSQFLSNYSRPPPLYSNFSPPPPYVPNFAQPPPVPWPLCQRDMPQMDHPPTTDICSSVKEMKKVKNNYNTSFLNYLMNLNLTIFLTVIYNF
jgi:hypothetical protein